MNQVARPTGPVLARHQFTRAASLDIQGLRRALGEVEGFNAKLAVIITHAVGTMACAYVFTLLALVGLPGAIQGGVLTIVQWIAQTFLQLVLLSIIMVGQAVQSNASDARAENEFKDTETILDRLDVKTTGGLHDVLAAIEQVQAQLAAAGNGSSGSAGGVAKSE
jgi:hypothetical protein